MNEINPDEGNVRPDVATSDGARARHEIHLTGNAAPGIAEATLAVDPRSPRAHVGLESSGAVPPGVRAELVDQVMGQEDLGPYDKVHVVMPLGDSESLHQLQQHTENLTARAAGASAAIDADLPKPLD